MQRPLRPLALAVLLAALLLRLGLAMTVDVPLVRGHDPRDYVRHATSIAAGNGYPELIGRPSALRPPAYPALLGLVFAVAPGERHLGFAQLVQALLGTALVALIGLVAARIWGKRAGLLAAALAAVYPPLLMIGATLMSEALLLPVTMAAVWALLRQRDSGSNRWAWIAGGLLGVAALTRSNAVVLLIPALLAVWRPDVRWTESTKAAAAVLAAGVLVILPWTARNAIVLRESVPLTTQTGFTVAGTYNRLSAADPDHPGAWRPPNLIPANARTLFDPRLSEREVERRLMEGALAYIGAHPQYVVKVVYRNALRMLELEPGWSTWSARLIDIRSPTLTLAARAAFYLVALIALLGVLLGLARRAPLFVWMFPLALFVSVVWVQSEVRFRLPIDPFILLLAGATLAVPFERLQGRRDEDPGSGATRVVNHAYHRGP